FGSPDGHVGVDGIVRAVNHDLGGCPHQTARCGGSPPLTGASLCGPPDRPCAVLADHTFPDAGLALAVDRRDRPALLTRDTVGAISYGDLSPDGVWQLVPTGFSGLPAWLDVTDAPLAL